MTVVRRRLCVVAILLAALADFVVAQQPTERVYVTRTATQYHRATCRYSAMSKIEMTLTEAAGRYQPCKVCKPPVLNSVQPATPAPVTICDYTFPARCARRERPVSGHHEAGDAVLTEREAGKQVLLAARR